MKNGKEYYLFSNTIDTLPNLDLEKEYIKSTIFSRNNDFHNRTEEKDISQNKNYYKTKILYDKERSTRRSQTEFDDEHKNTIDIKNSTQMNNNTNLNLDQLESKRLSKNLLFKTSLPIPMSKNDNLKNRKSFAHENMSKFFCPYCDHCNNFKDQNLEKHMQNLLQANVIINKGFDYMVKNLKFYDKTVIELFSFTDNNIEDIIKEDKPVLNDKNKIDDKEDIFEVMIN